MLEPVKLVLLWPANIPVNVVANQLAEAVRQTGLKPIVQTETTVDGAELLTFLKRAGVKAQDQGDALPADYTKPAAVTFTGTIADPTQNVAYSDSVTFSGGTAPFTVTASSTPTGIAAPTVSGRTLTFAGTPTGTGAVNWTASGTDANGRAWSFSQSVHTYAPVTVSGTLADGTHNVAYNQSLTLSGGKSPYSITTQTLPTDLTAAVSGTSVNVTGTHTTADSTDSIISGTDSEGRTWTYSRTIAFA